MMETVSQPTRPILTDDPRWIVAVLDTPELVHDTPVLDMVWQVWKPRKKWMGGWTYSLFRTGERVTITDDPDRLNDVRMELAAEGLGRVPFDVPVQVAYGYWDLARVSEWEMLRGKAR